MQEVFIYNIKIEMGASYEEQADTYTVEPQDKTVTITHESRSIIDFDVKSETKTVPVSEFQPIEDAFDKLNFTKVFKERIFLVCLKYFNYIFIKNHFLIIHHVDCFICNSISKTEIEYNIQIKLL
ncbi:MAG: hypothetical protein K6C98_05215 [Treponema sp.]|nr:hypothetical protein [Treponema sp.]